MLRKLFIIALCLVATTFTTQAQTQTPPDNEIWYTTTDGEIAELQNDEEPAPENDEEPASENGEDFEIVSHTYENGRGVIRANKPIKVGGDWDSGGFRVRGNIESVILPKGLTIIGDYAFSGCSSLTSITIPDSVTSIEWGAFSGCSSLTSITIPDSVTKIGGYAFDCCSSLTSITIPDSVTEIGDEAFAGCSSLPVIDNIRYADTYLVEVVDKSQASYTIKEGTRIIGSYASYGCSSLKSITIPDGVTSIGECAFLECNKLAKIVCLATEPPQIVDWWSDVYLGISEATKIYVPKESVKAYKQDEYWSQYAEQIVPIK